MNRKTLIVLTSLMVALGTFAPAMSQSQETRDLDAQTDGTAANTQTGETFDALVNVTGTVTIQDSDEGVDRAAFTQGQTATANVTVNGTVYTIPVGIVGEGTSLVQTGVSADAWRLHVQGVQLPDSGEDRSGENDHPDQEDHPGDEQAADGGEDPPTLAAFSGNMTLIGSEDGGYTAQGNGTLTVIQGEDTTAYELAYRGSATFD